LKDPDYDHEKDWPSYKMPDKPKKPPQDDDQQKARIYMYVKKEEPLVMVEILFENLTAEQTIYLVLNNEELSKIIDKKVWEE